MRASAKKLYNALLLLLSMILIAGIVSSLKNSSNVLNELSHLNLEILLLLILTHAVSFIFLALTQAMPLKKNNISLHFREYYGLLTVSELFNLVLPANGGSAIRMMYLKEKKALPIRQFLSMNFAILLIGFTMLGIVGTFYFQYFLNKNDSVFKLLESIFISLALCGILLLIISEILGRLFKIKRKYSPKIYLLDTKLNFKLTISWIIFFALYPVKIYLSFKAINLNIGFYEAFELSLILLITTFFQILPGNLGIKELVTVYISSHYGISLETALMASLIDRAAMTIYLLPLGSYYYWELILDGFTPKFALPFFRPSRSEQTSP